MRERWIDFRLAAAAIGRDDLEAPTSAGWTVPILAIRVVAGESYEHFAEHRRDLERIAR